MTMVETTIKSDKEVVQDLERKIHESLRSVESAIESNAKEDATRFLAETKDLYELRGYTTSLDRRYTKVWDEYLKKFPE